MDLGSAWRLAPLGQGQSHADALTLMATRSLREGQARLAFELMDRRCRLARKPGAGELAIRALAAHLCGWPDLAQADLARGDDADQTDALAAVTRLRLCRDEPARRQAAERLLQAHAAPPEAMRDALARLFQGDTPAFARLDAVDGQLSGWVAWTSGTPCQLEIGGLEENGVEEGERHPLVPDPASPFAGNGIEATFVCRAPAFTPYRYRIVAGDAVLAQGRLYPSSRAEFPGRRKGRLAPARIPARLGVTVLVPVYDDFAATRDCLRSVAAEATGREDIRILVVDDATPDREIALLLDALAKRGTIELLRNPVNLGFIGAVRRGLDAASGDVLLLNADAVLPRGGIERLARAVYGAPDIGTATPFSNNGEYTSLPHHGRAHPAPAPEEARRLDAAAAVANAGRVVDLPNGTGFCLYIRHDCLEAVGGLAEIYHRGYFEDLEFCLQARRAGFRNVCATDVYVVHHGSLSFGLEKRGLVARNLRLLRARFPDFSGECEAYAKADPLRAARAAIEANAPMEGHPVLVAAPEGSPTATERAFRLRRNGLAVLTLGYFTQAGRTRVCLRAGDGLMPQSLDFDLPQGADRLASYLRALKPAAVEVAGLPVAPPAVLAALRDAGPPLRILVGDHPPGEGFAPRRPVEGAGDGETDPPVLAAFRAWQAALEVDAGMAIVLDSASLGHLATASAAIAGWTVEADLPTRTEAPSILASPAKAPPTLGVLMPTPGPQCDSFVGALSTALRARRPDARIVVFGKAMDDLALMGRGNVFVTGPVGSDEVGSLARRYGASAITLPPPSTEGALFERVAAETGLPARHADADRDLFDAPASAQTQSGIGQTPPPSPLPLETSARVREHPSLAARRIVDWFADRL